MTQTNLIDLGNRLYKAAMVRREDEPITDPSGESIRWMLDTRTPMLDGVFFREVGEVVAERLAKRSVYQVAGLGYGSFPLVGSVLSTGEPFKGGFIRERRKGYGRKRLIEGPVHRDEPIVLLDDVLNSGKSAERAVDLLQSDGFVVSGVFTLFYFTWGKGKERLQERGVWVDSLLDLNLRNRGSSDGSSDSAARGASLSRS